MTAAMSSLIYPRHGLSLLLGLATGRLAHLPGVAAALLALGFLVLAPSPAVALDDLSRYVFIANRTSAEIAVVDTETDRVAARLTVAAIPDQFVLSESQAKLVASHRRDKRLTIVDLRRLETEAVLDLGFEPQQLRVDPFGSVLAVSGAKPDTVAILALDDIRERHRVRGIADPGYLVFDVRAERLLVASRSAPRITALEVASGAVIKEIDLAGGLGNGRPAGIAHFVRTPGGTLAFALHGSSGRLTALDLYDLRPIKTFGLLGPAERAFTTADSQYILVPNERDQSVSMVSTWTLTESKHLPGAKGMSGVNTGLFERIAVVLSRDESKALLLDLDDGRRITEIPLPSLPETGITADAGRKVYVALSGSNQVAVIDLTRFKLVKMIDGVGRQPWAVSMAGGLSYCH